MPCPADLLRSTATLLAVAWTAACSPTEPADPYAASWLAAPSQLVLAAGVPETLAVSFLTDRGALVASDYIRWYEWDFQGNAALSIQFTGAPFENPQRLLVQAPAAASGTLIIRVGITRGCDDPPLCLLQHWEQELTDLVIPFQASAAFR